MAQVFHHRRLWPVDRDHRFWLGQSDRTCLESGDTDDHADAVADGNGAAHVDFYAHLDPNTLPVDALHGHTYQHADDHADTHRDADEYTYTDTNFDEYTDADEYTYTDAHAYAHANADSNLYADSHSYTDVYAYANGDADAFAHRDEGADFNGDSHDNRSGDHHSHADEHRDAHAHTDAHTDEVIVSKRLPSPASQADRLWYNPARPDRLLEPVRFLMRSR